MAFLFYGASPQLSTPTHASFFNNRKQSAVVFHHKLTLVPARCHWVSVVVPASPCYAVHRKVEGEWGLWASLLISLSYSEGGSDTWPSTGNFTDWYQMNRSLSVLQSNWTYTHNPLCCLIGKTFIIEKSHLQNHISPLKVIQGFC